MNNFAVTTKSLTEWKFCGILINMNQFNKDNIYSRIEQTPNDPAVGIRLALLWEESDKVYYGSLIAPNKSIAPHYHNVGDELYFIIGGSGVMRIDDCEFEVETGDFFTVPAKAIHQLSNTSDEDMLAVFACDPNHLKGDRFVVER